MKKIMICALAVMVMVLCLTGCGSRNDTEPVNPGPSPEINTDNVVKPEDNNGIVEDQNGIIGDSNAEPNEGVIPEIGQDIEQGADNIIGDVENAIDDMGSGNGSGNADDSADGKTRSRTRMN